jgi:hypothetical protein
MTRRCPPDGCVQTLYVYFVGGVVGTTYYSLGLVPPGYIPLVILLAGLGAVFCVSFFDR